MFLEEIGIIDVILEGIKALTMLILIFVMSGAGDKYPQLAEGPWGLIRTGFLLMFIGFLFDFSDEIINYEAAQWAETGQAFIEEATLIGGLILATVGFGRWFDFVGRFMGLEANK